MLSEVLGNYELFCVRGFTGMVGTACFLGADGYSSWDIMYGYRLLDIVYGYQLLDIVYRYRLLGCCVWVSVVGVLCVGISR